jgi:DNA-binding GntR family transcriptional regulator
MSEQRQRYGSAREWVYHELRQRILSGELASGQQLRSKPLTEQFGVSVSPLREAIHQLAANGFVELSPQRGAKVKAISLRDVADLYEARLLLEPEAARRSVTGADEALLTLVESTFELLASEDTIGPDEDAGLRARAATTEERFLAAVCVRCANVWLVDALETLRSHTARSRTVLPIAIDLAIGRPALVAIRDAVVAKDADAAGAAVTELLQLRGRIASAVAAA